MSKTLLTLGLFLLAGQVQPDSTLVDTSVLIDTVLYHPGQVLIPYSPVTNPENLEKSLSQNPTAALFKSLLVPGLGQIGNRRYVKAALFMGLDAWFVGSAIHYGRQASDFRRQFESSTIPSDRNEYYDLYLDRKSKRNKFTWYAVIVTFISMFDAYVDAHLSGFPKKEKEGRVSVNLLPPREGRVVAFLSISF